MSYPNYNFTITNSIPPMNYTPIQVPNHITRDNYVAYVTKVNNYSTIINNALNGSNNTTNNNNNK